MGQAQSLSQSLESNQRARRLNPSLQGVITLSQPTVKPMFVVPSLSDINHSSPLGQAQSYAAFHALFFYVVINKSLTYYNYIDVYFMKFGDCRAYEIWLD